MAEHNVVWWSAGDRVLHKDYGIGEVVKVDANDNTLHYLVEFPDKAKKWFPLWNDRDVIRKLGE